MVCIEVWLLYRIDNARQAPTTDRNETSVTFKVHQQARQHMGCKMQQCMRRRSVPPVNMPYKAKRRSVAHRTQHEEESIAHHEHVSKVEGRLHEA